MNDPLTTAEACQAFAAFSGKKPSRRTLMRWLSKGVRSPRGERVVLASRLIGGRRYVHRRAIEDFIAALNQEPYGTGPGTGETQAKRRTPLVVSDARRALREEFGFDDG